MTYDDVLKVPRGIPGTHGTMVSVMNQKGGVGKSTTAINLSAALSEMGMKVLVIDLDPQGNATSGYGVDKDDLEHDMYDVIIDGTDVRDIIVPTCEPRVFLAPATINLAGAEIQLVSKMAREMLMREALAPIRDDFDYIMVDCPPSLGLLTINALTASNGLVIPIQSEYYALEGVTKLLESMKMVKQALNRNLAISGILLTMYDPRTNLSRDVANEVRKYFGKLTFDTVIPRSTSMAEAPSHGKPITMYAPSSIGAKAYRSVAMEILARTTNGNVDLERLVAEAKAKADAEARERERERRLEIARRNFANLRDKGAKGDAKPENAEASVPSDTEASKDKELATEGTEEKPGTPKSEPAPENDRTASDVREGVDADPKAPGAEEAPTDGVSVSSDSDREEEKTDRPSPTESHDAAADLVADYAALSRDIDSMDEQTDEEHGESHGSANGSHDTAPSDDHASVADRFADELTADLEGSMGEIDDAVEGSLPEQSPEEVEKAAAAFMRATGHDDDDDDNAENSDASTDGDDDFDTNADFVEDPDDFNM